jgi:Tfp pilus assembly protein PilF
MAGDIAGAEGSLREALRADPRDEQSLLMLAELLRRSGRGDEAEELLRSAAHAPPSPPGPEPGAPAPERTPTGGTRP